MELDNEVTLDGTTYCFEDFWRVIEAKAWIAGNVSDASGFRLVFPDATPVNTDPIGLDDMDGY